MMEPAEAVFEIEELEDLDEHNDESPYGGYDFVFVDELSPGQTCSICLVAMRNPVQTVCGHRFCEDCLVGTFREGRGHACPQDRLYIPEEGGFFRDVAWERDILSLRVKCKMNERGCDWTGQLRHYESHFLECQFEDVVCDDCKDKMHRRFLDKHSTSECRERIVQCVYCNGEFAFWCLELHEDEHCTRFPLECPQQCGVQDIPREEVESHVEDECLMTLVVCPYKGAGCTYQDKRINLKAHVEEYSEYHLSKTWSELQKTKQELLDVTCEMKKIEEVKNRVETLQSEKDDMEMSLQRNKEEISDLKLSEKKLEVENMSLSKEVNELGRQLAEVKTNAATENRSLRELLQSMQKKLEDIERKEAGKIMPQETTKIRVEDVIHKPEPAKRSWYKKQEYQSSDESETELSKGRQEDITHRSAPVSSWYKKQEYQSSDESETELCKGAENVPGKEECNDWCRNEYRNGWKSTREKATTIATSRAKSSKGRGKSPGYHSKLRD